MRVLSLQAIVEGRLRQMSNGFMLLKSFCNCKGEEHAFKNGVSNYGKEVTLHSWKWCFVGAGWWVFEAALGRQQSQLPTVALRVYTRVLQVKPGGVCAQES